MSLPAPKQQMWEAYKGTTKPVVYLDESFHLDGANRFYILGTACVLNEDLDGAREDLKSFYDGDALHASAMMRNSEFESLRLATKLVDDQHAGADIVVCTEVDEGDTQGDAARRKCIEFIVPRLHVEFGTQLYVFDHRGPANRFDQWTISDLRKDGQLGRDVRAMHCQPSVEPLLGLPDILAWSFRQKFVRNSDEWFSPMEARTEVHRI